MNWKRKRIGSAKIHKEWRDGPYRIRWRSQVAGVEVTPAYYAMVECVAEDGYQYWGFAGKRGPYKTFKAAEKACEKNQRLWRKFLVIDGRDKVAQFRAIKARSLVGAGEYAYSILTDLPIWVRKQASERLLEILCSSSRKGHSETSTSSDVIATPAGTAGPVSNASDVDGTTTPTTHPTPSRETDTGHSSTATPVTEPAKAPAKPSSKRTARRSPSTRKKGTAITSSSKSRRRHSKSSRRKKSKRSQS